MLNKIYAFSARSAVLIINPIIVKVQSHNSKNQQKLKKKNINSKFKNKMYKKEIIHILCAEFQP